MDFVRRAATRARKGAYNMASRGEAKAKSKGWNFLANVMGKMRQLFYPK